MDDDALRDDCDDVFVIFRRGATFDAGSVSCPIKKYIRREIRVLHSIFSCRRRVM